jgi:hypothetical protein
MGVPVRVLVIDPVRGYQRQVEAGETLVDGDGNPLLYPGFGPPVDDIPALKALLPARRVDQQVRLVEDADPNTPGVDYPSNYAWDSVLPDDAPATGRWIRVYSEVNNHHEIHEIGGRDEVTIENLITDEYGPGSSSSSPGAGQAVKVLVPDGGGGVVWYDLTTTIEDSVTDELEPDSILQPDGAGGVAWQPHLIENIPTNEDSGGTSSSPGPSQAVKVLVPDGGGGVVWYDLAIELENHSTDELDPDTVLLPDGAGGVSWQSFLIEDSPTDEDDGGASSSPGPGQSVKVLVPDGAGGVLWYDLATTIENAVTGELNPNFILQPDGAGGVSWVAYDPVIEGDLDMNCNDLTYVGGVYFCDFGSSSSGGSSGPTDLWVRPDRDTGQQLEYHASGGHRFESPVWMTGQLNMGSNSIVSVSDPTNAQDAATKAYVDAGIAAIGLAEVLTTSNDAEGLTIEGVCGLYFSTGCGGGSSSSPSGGEVESRILPDNDRLHYYADGGHWFEDAMRLEAGNEFVFENGTGARLATYQWDGSDFILNLSNSGSNFEIWLEGQTYYAFDSDRMTIERTDDGSSMFLEINSWAAASRSQLKISGVGHTTYAAANIQLNSGGSDWHFYNMGPVHTTEADDFLLKRNNVSQDWLRFDVSESLIILTPDGADGISISSTGDVVADGGLTVGGDIDMACNEIMYAAGITFCDFGSSSSSGSSGPSDLWIRPDFESGQQLEYHAEGGHRFESPVMMAGDLVLNHPTKEDEWMKFSWGTNYPRIQFIDDSVDFEFYWGSTLYHTMKEDLLRLRNTGGGMDLDVEGYTGPAQVDISGLSDTGFGASHLWFKEYLVAPRWAMHFQGASYTDEANDLIFEYDPTGVADEVWLRFDVSETAMVLAPNGGTGLTVYGATGDVTIDGDLETVGYVRSDDAFYLGAPDAANSWRFRVVDGDLVFEQRDLVAWYECDRISACASSSSSSVP